MTYLLDSHVLVWWAQGGGRLTRRQKRELDRADGTPPFLVSDMSLLEIARLHERGRIGIRMPLREWFERLIAPPLVRLCGISPVVAAEIANLPASFHRDPVDRVLVATARVHGVTLMTSDRRIIDSGIVPVLH